MHIMQCTTHVCGLAHTAAGVKLRVKKSRAYTSDINLCILSANMHYNQLSGHPKQDAQLSQRDRAAGCIIVFVKSRTLERGDNDLRIL